MKKSKAFCLTMFLAFLCCIFSTQRVEASAAEFYKGHRYQVIDESMKWQDAKAACEEMGGHLVTITSKAEQKFVYSLLKNTDKNIYWIGLYKTGSSRNWVTGEAFSYSNIEKENSGQSYYGMYGGAAEKAQKTKGEWYDHDDTIRNDFWDYTNTGYICEWDSTPLKYTDITLSKKTYYYDGKAKKPSVKVVLDGTVLKKDKDYTVTYSNNKKAGTGKVIIKGKGNYTGKITKTFKIIKRSVKLNKSKITIKNGETFKLKATVKGESQKVVWTSSSKKTAVVSKNGVVTGKKKGIAYITAEANGEIAICKVIVK